MVDENWHPYFTYFPMFIEGRFCWFVWIERRAIFGEDGVVYDYRLKQL